MISGFQNTGRSEVQLNHGPSVAFYNETLLNEEVKRLEELSPDEADAMRLLIKNRQRIADAASEKKAKPPAAKPRPAKKTGGYVSQEAGISQREKEGTFQGMSVKKDEYIPDHGEAIEEPLYTEEEWNSLSEAEKGDILLRQAIAKRIKRNRALKAQKREVSRGKRKSGKTSDKVYDYMLDKEEGKDQKTEKNPPQSYQYAEAKFDDIDKKALKGKFKNREDQDIDNDGDEDESDRYLHRRRKAISKKKNGNGNGSGNGNGNGNGEKIEINPEIKETIRKLIHSTLK